MRVITDLSVQTHNPTALTRLANGDKPLLVGRSDGHQTEIKSGDTWYVDGSRPGGYFWFGPGDRKTT